jgi:NADPH:quinone reductase-like Zn-dependent oxidoreductase
MTTTGKQLFSTLEDGKLTVEIVDTEFAQPVGNQVLVEMEAAPINPSDLAILTGMAELENAEYSPGKFVAVMPEPFNSAQKGRHGKRLPAGNEGAGKVVASGDSEAAQSLLGQRVACVPGNAYSQYCLADAGLCLPLGSLSSEQGASAFVNPMTVLGFVETARMEQQGAIIHTAAASNLGQMLIKVCHEDNIPLVNIVRRQEHVGLLKDLGANHVINSSDDDFIDQLCAAISETNAYCGFDPIGGGHAVDNCFKAMERVAASKMTEFSRYGSDQAKKMYIYGRLDFGPTLLTPSYGFGWTLSGWLLTPFLQKAGLETLLRMRERVLDGLSTTFASTYKRKVSLEEMLTREAVLDYRTMKTGEKYLVTPQV